MDIFWYGQSCFEIKTPSSSATGKRVVVINPLSKESGLKTPKLEADIILVTGEFYKKEASTVRGNPFIIERPGEYEVKEIYVRGIPAYSTKQNNNGQKDVTIYKVEADGLVFCHLGDFGQQELTSEQTEALEKIDILMIPTGGGDTIEGSVAQKIVNQIEPKIVIPMSFHLPQLKEKLEPVDKFLKAMGQEKKEPEPVIKIKPEKLPPETSIMVLKP